MQLSTSLLAQLVESLDVATRTQLLDRTITNADADGSLFGRGPRDLAQFMFVLDIDLG